jgi:hypothetical protein
VDNDRESCCANRDAELKGGANLGGRDLVVIIIPVTDGCVG